MPEPNEPQGPYGSARFAAKRSHQDALLSNQNLKAAAQSMILINGGAATAVIAFMSKENIAPFFLGHVPFVLFSYAVGVACGAIMVFCAGRALKYWGYSWRDYMVDPKAVVKVESNYQKASRWDFCSLISFILGMLAFVIGSVGLGVITLIAPHTIVAQPLMVLR